MKKDLKPVPMWLWVITDVIAILALVFSFIK